MKLKHLLWSLIFVPVGQKAQIQIKALVTFADDGMPLSSALFVVKGPTSGSTNDLDGNFSLKDVPSNET
jgi:hypothetical protein